MVCNNSVTVLLSPTLCPRIVIYSICHAVIAPWPTEESAIDLLVVAQVAPLVGLCLDWLAVAARSRSAGGASSAIAETLVAFEFSRRSRISH
jgi:hypothetical protein